MEKDYWYTLAYSDIGTHKMKFSEKMSKVAAEVMGKYHCLDKNLEYVGTYDVFEIDQVESELRKRLYEN